MLSVPVLFLISLQADATQFNADREETDLAYRLGKIFYQGSINASRGGIASGSEGVGAVPRDLHRARYYFSKIMKAVWPQDPASSLGDDSGAPTGGVTPAALTYAALSAGYLGRMYLRGEGVKPDAAIAKVWFERGAEHAERESHNGLGIIYRDGLVHGHRDAKLAGHHFFVAAKQELAEAQVNLGKMYYGQWVSLGYVSCAVLMVKRRILRARRC
jgi:SEL1 protein